MSLSTETIDRHLSRVSKSNRSRSTGVQPPASLVAATGLTDQKAGVPTDRAADTETPLLFSEDLSVGDCWTTPFRTISEQDVGQFAALTGDHTPLHEGDANRSPFGQPVAHGLLGLSVLAGLGTSCPSVSTLALVGIEDWQFVAPVFFGDRVQARNRIDAIDAHGRRAVKVRWLRELINEAGQVLQRGNFVTLVGSRKRSQNKPR